MQREKEREEKARAAQTSVSGSVASIGVQYKSKFAKRLEDEARRRQEEEERERQEKLARIKRRQAYGQVVREVFRPAIDADKQRELLASMEEEDKNKREAQVRAASLLAALRYGDAPWPAARRPPAL